MRLATTLSMSELARCHQLTLVRAIKRNALTPVALPVRTHLVQAIVAAITCRDNGKRRLLWLFHGDNMGSNPPGANVHFTVSVIEIGAGFGTPPVFVEEMVMR
jgi:hypothetical protein